MGREIERRKERVAEEKVEKGEAVIDSPEKGYCHRPKLSQVLVLSERVCTLIGFREKPLQEDIFEVHFIRPRI
ncbi:hypothetical protein CsSME_00019997 [Camellia sinensis var. sinensis]